MNVVRLGGILCIAAAFGCASYQVGSESLFPTDVQTVYVPMFESDSFRPKLGEQLTEAVVKRIEATTGYKVVSDPNADSVLTGRIISDNKRVLVENRFGDAREVETNIFVEARWTRRDGTLIAQDSLIPFDPHAVLVTGTASVVPESGQSVATAHLDSVERVARQVVDMMEIPW